MNQKLLAVFAVVIVLLSGLVLVAVSKSVQTADVETVGSVSVSGVQTQEAPPTTVGSQAIVNIPQAGAKAQVTVSAE